ncbi:MAG TPA: shikimate dehydrogenase [Actinopolymorphaceae bacterium]|nr:shikimate dehydrogenase [Actinopolymorphaceae bacterium]
MTATPSTGRRCAVLGSPIAHSLSPVLHRTAYAELGLDWRYDAFEVDEAALPGFVDRLGPEWRGLSLTMPLKRAVIPLCDEVLEPATLVGAVNTLLLDDGRRTGANTDVPGIVAALRERGVTSVRRALVLGVGATACSALAGLAEIGIAEVRAVARDPARAGELRALAYRLDVDVSVVSWDVAGATARGGAGVDIVVSTVPEPAAAEMADLAVERAEVVFDVLYHPWPTRLARTAKASGRVVVGGLDLLVHQAGVQVELMTGRIPAPVAAMRLAGEEALRAKGA